MNKTKVNYWSDVFTHLKPFDELGRDDLVPLYDKVNDYISSLPKHNRYYFIETEKEINPAIEYQNEDKTFFHYHLNYTSIDEFNNTELKDLEQLLFMEDQVIYNWYFKKDSNNPIPNTKVSAMLKNFKL